MCSKEAFPFHLIYLKFPFFLPVPAPDGLHIIQVAGSCLCFWQAKAKDLLCVISWTPGVALQITKRDARFLHSCHFHIFSPIIYSPHMGNFWPIFITFRVCWDKRLCLWTGWLFQLPQGSFPGGSCSLSLLTASWQHAPPTPWGSSTHLLHHIQVLQLQQPPREHRGWKPRCPGLHGRQCGQQAEVSDSASVPGTGDNPAGVVHPALWASAQERHGPAGASPEGSHKDG